MHHPRSRPGYRRGMARCVSSCHRLRSPADTRADHASDIAEKLQEASKAIPRCGASLAQSGDDHDRVKRGLERLRRAAVKIVEPPTNADTECPSEVRTCVRGVLEQIIDVLCEKVRVAVSIHYAYSCVGTAGRVYLDSGNRRCGKPFRARAHRLCSQQPGHLHSRQDVL